MVHDGEKEKQYRQNINKYYDGKFRHSLQNKVSGKLEGYPMNFEIDVSRYEDYPFDSEKFSNFDMMMAYMSWVKTIQLELIAANPKHKMSPKYIRKTIRRMKEKEWKPAFAAYRESRLSTLRIDERVFRHHNPEP